MDINPTECLLIDMSDRKELLSIGKVYDITILKGGNEKQLKKELRDLLAILDSNLKQEVIKAKPSDTGTFTTVRASKSKRKVLENQVQKPKKPSHPQSTVRRRTTGKKKRTQKRYRRKPAKRRLFVQKKNSARDKGKT